MYTLQVKLLLLVESNNRLEWEITKILMYAWPTVGIEPTTTWLKATRSTTELGRLLTGKLRKYIGQGKAENGKREGIILLIHVGHIPL